VKLFEKYIEGFFNKKFSSGLQPVEIAKQLVRQMDDEKTVGISKIYVPNAYIVYLHKADYEKIGSYSQSICKELSQYLVDQAKSKNYTMSGNPSVEIDQEVDGGESVNKGSFRIVSSFSEPLPEENQVLHLEEEVPEIFSTRVFNKVEYDPIKKSCLVGLLTVVEGPDLDLQVAVSGNRINIGRRASNELPLTDMNTSRLQAYVVYEESVHIIYDAKSLNGTYVNGHRIMRNILETGDRIKIGNTTIVYEVN